MYMHGPFGFASGARGVHQDGEILGRDRLRAGLKQTCVRGLVRATHVLELLEANHLGVIQVAQALHVEHHDMAQVGQAGARLKGFVELFVILNKQHARIRVGTQVGHLLSGIGRVDTAAHATTAKDRQISEYPIGIGVGQDGYTLFGR